jgi:hypothetical protein
MKKLNEVRLALLAGGLGVGVKVHFIEIVVVHLHYDENRAKLGRFKMKKKMFFKTN